MSTYISLLRGINVGGHKIIKMAALKTLYEGLGFAGVQTLLQSGNVVFEGDHPDPAALVRRIEEAIETTFGFHADVILRIAKEWTGVIDRNPLQSEAKDDPSRMSVMFLAASPSKEAKAKLTTAHNGPEQLEFSGRELFLYYPDGIGRSKLTNALIERNLGLTGTARNWNTVIKLAHMAEGFEAL